MDASSILDDNKSSEDAIPRKKTLKQKKRSLVERELETNLTARVTSPLTNSTVTPGGTSRYGRARKLISDTDLNSSPQAMPKKSKSPKKDVTISPIKAQSPVYRMHASNSPLRTDSSKTTNHIESPLMNRIECIYNETVSLSRFSKDEGNNKSPSKASKVYIQKDLIQRKEKNDTALLLKNMFSPTKSCRPSTSTHLNNILERSSEKYALMSTNSYNGYLDNSSVVKALDFDSGKKKQGTKSGSKNGVDKEDLANLETQCVYQVGDLAWARVGSYPFWPCIVSRDPYSDTFVTKKGKDKASGNVGKQTIHVIFFGDNGRRGWIAEKMLRKYLGIQEFEQAKKNLTPEAKRKDPKLYAAYSVSSKNAKWKNSIDEAEMLFKEPQLFRLDVLNDMLIRNRSAKTTPKTEKSGKLTRKDSDVTDVSLSESLYDTLFSEDDTKTDDIDRAVKKPRKNSLDVSEVVTACLDNMAAKTGLTRIQRQSHMDRWLQKAKSKTPEKINKKTQPSLSKKKINNIVVPKSALTKVVRKYTKKESQKKSKVIKVHQGEVSSTLNNSALETKFVSSEENGYGTGFISKEKTLNDKQFIRNDSINSSENECIIDADAFSDNDKGIETKTHPVEGHNFKKSLDVNNIGGVKKNVDFTNKDIIDLEEEEDNANKIKDSEISNCISNVGYDNVNFNPESNIVLLDNAEESQPIIIEDKDSNEIKETKLDISECSDKLDCCIFTISDSNDSDAVSGDDIIEITEKTIEQNSSTTESFAILNKANGKGKERVEEINKSHNNKEVSIDKLNVVEKSKCYYMDVDEDVSLDNKNHNEILNSDVNFAEVNTSDKCNNVEANNFKDIITATIEDDYKDSGNKINSDVNTLTKASKDSNKDVIIDDNKLQNEETVSLNLKEENSQPTKINPDEVLENIGINSDVNENCSSKCDTSDLLIMNSTDKKQSNNDKYIRNKNDIINGKENLNEIYNNLEFLKYFELKHILLADEHPNLSESEILIYLYKTWTYEQDLKSKRLKKDEGQQSNLVEDTIVKPQKAKSTNKIEENLHFIEDSSGKIFLNNCAVDISQQKLNEVENKFLSPSASENDNLETKVIKTKTKIGFNGSFIEDSTGNIVSKNCAVNENCQQEINKVERKSVSSCAFENNKIETKIVKKNPKIDLNAFFKEDSSGNVVSNICAVDENSQEKIDEVEIKTVSLCALENNKIETKVVKINSKIDLNASFIDSSENIVANNCAGDDIFQQKLDEVKSQTLSPCAPENNKIETNVVKTNTKIDINASFIEDSSGNMFLNNCFNDVSQQKLDEVEIKTLSPCTLENNKIEAMVVKTNIKIDLNASFIEDSSGFVRQFVSDNCAVNENSQQELDEVEIKTALPFALKNNKTETKVVKTNTKIDLNASFIEDSFGNFVSNNCAVDENSQQELDGVESKSVSLCALENNKIETKIVKTKTKMGLNVKKYDDPDFLRFVEKRQDEVIDEAPDISHEDLMSYLYNSWSYQQKSKSEEIKNKDLQELKLVKVFVEDIATTQPKKVKRKKTEKILTDYGVEVITKEKPLRKKIVKPFYNELDSFSDSDDDFDSDNSKQISSKSKIDTDGQTKSGDDLKDETSEYDEAEYFLNQLTTIKPNLFKGLIRERVCEICEKTSNLVKCKGSCAGMFHIECVAKPIEPVLEHPASKGRKKKKPRGRRPKGSDDQNESKLNGTDSESQSDEKSQDTNMSMDLEEVTTPNIVSTVEDFEAQLAVKMKEILDETDAIDDSQYTEDELDWNNTVAGQCEIVDVKLKPKVDNLENQYADFKCNDCQQHDTPICFVCKSDVSPKNKIALRQRCNVAHCHKFYHLECLEQWPQTQFNSGEPSRSNKKISENFETITCPRHVCHTCVCDDPRGCKTRFSGDKLAKCVRCPAVYHSFTKCLPAGSQILTGSHIICPRHYENRPGKVPCHVNTGWCFICALGGSLICCEYCPTSFHAECLNIKPPEGGYMCEDCETGRLPLYGEMVWVKLGHYRWWPGVVLHPVEIPDNILSVKHSPGEFVVRFFGQYDHYWVNRGRVFPFEEGDSGRITKQKSKIDAAFTRAIEDAQRACEILKNAQMNAEESSDIASSLLPPHYVKLKVNKPCGSLVNWKPDSTEANSLTQCECDPDDFDPCGLDSQCLNRMLLTECGPTCRAGDRCNNRSFEKRRYPKLVPYRTPHRGWGLRTLEDIKKGQFVIEYVGELLDEEEFRRRMRRMHEMRDENFYFLTLDKDRMIDAGPKGNLARFMNHSCEPNTETQKWTVLGDVRVGLFAIHDIPAKTEVNFNYNLESAGIEKKQCMCGAKRCSGYIGAKPKQEESQPKKQKVQNKRSYKKRKPSTLESPPTVRKPKTPRARQRPKPRELTEIEKDLLIIKNATNGLSSDSESIDGKENSKSLDSNVPMKRKRVSFSTEEEENTSNAKKSKMAASDLLTNELCPTATCM